jgi:hypothetical protein
MQRAITQGIDMGKPDIRARKHLIEVLRQLAENREPQSFDATGEAAYAALFQLGVVEGSFGQAMLRTSAEAESVARVLDSLDQMFNVIGNCPDEERNLKRIAWSQIADQAQTVCEILTI